MSSARLGRRVILAAPLCVLPLAARPAAAGDFAGFIAAVRRQALDDGVSAATVDRALRSAQYLPHVIELDRRQPERVLSLEEYLERAVSPQREETARRRLAAFRPLLDRVWRQYGVDPRYIVALWGLESNFGTMTGSYPVVASLATLGYDGRRSGLFRGELIDALRILDRGDIPLDEMTGSWAGAMGQCQFMPSTFLRYAVDYDNGGRRDIWNDHADVFASIANFIAHLGWRGGEGWGREVLLPAGFDSTLAGLERERPLAEWARLGLRSRDGGALPASRRDAALLLPDGPQGRALLVYGNFRTIMRWNRSTYFATAVGLLADSMERG